MKHVLPASFFLLMLASPPVFAQYAPRLFDVVAPPGHEVQQQDGAAVLRLPGKRYGSVLTFVPESAETGWITLAVVNTGSEPFEANTASTSAHYGRTQLKVHQTSALVREQTRRRAEMLNYSQAAEGKSLKDLTAPNRALEETRQMRRSGSSGGGRNRQGSQAGTVGDPTTGRPRSYADRPQYVAGSADAREAKALADAQLIAMKERLFPDATVSPGKFSRGDIKVELPPRRQDQPAEFVLRLDFADEVMEVTFRERWANSGGSVDVGELEQTESSQ